MRYIRLVHPKHYDARTRKFKNLAFKNSSDGSGASVILEACGAAASGSICAHIRRHYPGIGGEPPVFWPFDDSVLPAGHVIEQDTSDAGDDCHHVVKGVTNGTLKRNFVDKWELSDLAICDNGTYRPLTAADVDSAA